MEKFILLGAARGLGWATYKKLKLIYDESEFLLVSRKIRMREKELGSKTILIEQDFSKLDWDENFVSKLKDFKPTCLIYFAGGGPFGTYQSKNWNSHIWCINTTFLYPARLVHRILSDAESWSQLQDFVLIGSSIAESKPDPNAASYAAAKHALLGLVQSLNLEQKTPVRVNLFSPGYMQTDLLPPNSRPRLNDSAENPDVVAERLIEYINSVRKS
jgi:short-subunit dehydrogenase